MRSGRPDARSVLLEVFNPVVLSIGQLLPPGDLTTFRKFLSPGTDYVPVIADAGPLQGRIIGFGSVQVVPDGANPLQAQITRQTGQIASENASAVLVNPLDASVAGLVNDLLKAHNEMANPLLAPALVR